MIRICQPRLKLLLKLVLCVLSVLFVLDLALYVKWENNRRNYNYGLSWIPLNPPPKLSTDHEIILNSINLQIKQKHGNKHKKLLTVQVQDKENLLQKLSKVVQNQLIKLQSISSNECDKRPTLLCGHWDKCGLGCQAHHRIPCLMISYSLNMPLIHDEITGWPYSKKWSDLFEPLGSNCSMGLNTYKVKWQWTGESAPSISKKNCFLFCPTETLEYPLEYGIPIPKQIAEILEEIHPSAWFWWVGQFTKYALRLSQSQRASLELQKKEIGFSNNIRPIVGIQIRRTDKFSEAADSIHDLDAYFNAAEKYFSTTGHNNSIRTVFIASDSHFVLNEARLRYKNDPKWNVLTFPSITTLETQDDRSEALDTMVRDLVVLSECDYVICGFSSNICRLLLEMLSYQHINPLERLKSLDVNHFYQYELQANPIPQKLIKI